MTSERVTDIEALSALTKAHERLRAEIAKAVFGQDEVVEQLLIAIFSGGHCILEGVPGLAKTLLVSTLAGCLDLDFTRIQFTPDLMPSDITGTEVMQEDKATGRREFRFIPGPIFHHVVLADEINRTPPKTQAALLEGMQERQVSGGGRRHTPATPCRSRSSFSRRRIRSSKKAPIRCPKRRWIVSCSRWSWATPIARSNG